MDQKTVISWGLGLAGKTLWDHEKFLRLPRDVVKLYTQELCILWYVNAIKKLIAIYVKKKKRF